MVFNKIFSAFPGFMTAPGSQRGEKIMKKRIASGLLASAMALCLAECTGNAPAVSDKVEEAITDTVEEAVEEVTDQVEDVAEAVGDAAEEVQEQVGDALGDGVMTYAEYAEAALDSEVTVVTYVQAHQSWWDGKVTVYTQDQDGGYFLYELPCTEEDAEKLVPGTKIKVTGYKSEWSGEVEITDSSFEFVEDGDSYIAEAVDVTDKIGTDDIANYMNQKVVFTDMTVEKIAFKNDEPGDDIYVTLSKDGIEVNFCLEYYLNGSDAEFYEQVGNLEIGSVVDVEAFLYWYEGPNPHITAVTVK